MYCCLFFFFKQKTAYEMRISDWSSDVALPIFGTDSWKIAKRFLKGPQVEVTGPQGRAQGEEAENRLQALLGFVKDSSQRGDPATYGALGLLWVTQAQALEVTAPGSIVRSRLQATLGAEGGRSDGGAACERVWAAEAAGGGERGG